MRSTARISTAGRAGRALIGLGTAAGFVLLVPAQAWALPPGCTQSGANFTCTAGIPAGQVLNGTSGNNIITITLKTKGAPR